MVELVQGVVFAVYMVGVLLIGVWASRYTEETPNSFYLADRRLGVVVLLFTLAATIMSSFTFFGIGATARGTGLGLSGLIAIHMILFALIFTTLGVKVHRVGDRYGYATPSEYLRNRFDNGVVPVVYVVLTTLGLIGFATIQIIGGGVALNVLMDLPYVWSIVLIAAFMAIYIHISGMTGVAWSDTMQGAIMFLSLVAAFIGILVIVGPATLVQNVQNNSPDLFTMAGPVGAWVPKFTVSFSIFFAIGVLAYPQIYHGSSPLSRDGPSSVPHCCCRSSASSFR
jgi:SSS family solute:Na+ symporter